MGTDHSFQKSKTKISVLAILLLCGCSQPTPIPLEEFDGERAFRHAETQVSYGPRPPGSEAHQMTGDYISQVLEENGWQVREQSFQFNQIEGRNIYGVAGPEDGLWIILGAHYDTRPVADQDEFAPETPVVGANDGASGVAVLLELSRILKPSSLNIHLWLTFFDAEDSGGINGNQWAFGAMNFAQSLDGRPDAVVIVDMIGDADLNIYQERNSNPSLTNEIWKVAGDLGYPGFIPEPGRTILDDHVPFLQIGIPAVDIIDFDYPYWHTTEDTLDKISADSLEQVGRTLQTWLLAKQPLAENGD